MGLKARTGHHFCPRPGCEVEVPDRLFACQRDWYALPDTIRAAILRTARLSVLAPARREALARAGRAWADLLDPT